MPNISSEEVESILRKPAFVWDKGGYLNEASTIHGERWIYDYVTTNIYTGTNETDNIRNTSLNTENVSLGDFYVDSSIGQNYLSGSCNFIQWGNNTTLKVSEIN